VFVNSGSANGSFFVSFICGKFVKFLFFLSRLKLFTGHIFFMVFVTFRTVAGLTVHACHVLQVLWNKDSSLAVGPGSLFENFSADVFNIARSKIEKLLVNFCAT